MSIRIELSSTTRGDLVIVATGLCSGFLCGNEASTFAMGTLLPASCARLTRTAVIDTTQVPWWSYEQALQAGVRDVFQGQGDLLARLSH